MSWFHNRYTERPASKNQGARIAWDELSRRAALMTPPRTLDRLWFAPEMDDGFWCARLHKIADEEDEDYIDMDVLEVSDRKNNPHRYAKSNALP
jgi:hypothetical protein